MKTTDQNRDFRRLGAARCVALERCLGTKARRGGGRSAGFRAAGAAANVNRSPSMSQPAGGGQGSNAPAAAGRHSTPQRGCARRDSKAECGSPGRNPTAECGGTRAESSGRMRRPRAESSARMRVRQAGFKGLTQERRWDPAPECGCTWRDSATERRRRRRNPAPECGCAWRNSATERGRQRRHPAARGRRGRATIV